VRRRLSEGAWARWGLLTSAFALGVILIAASWSNYRSARAATTTLYVGQARVFEREIMSLLRRSIERADPQDLGGTLDSLLHAQAAEGLRYVGLVGETGAIEASAGQPAVARETPVEVGDEDWVSLLTRVGSRVRMSFGRPPGGPGDGPAGGPADASAVGPAEGPAGSPLGSMQGQAPPMPMPPMPEGERARFHRRLGIVFEFEPVVASHLLDQAGRLLAFGLAAALVMMLVAAVSHAMSRRYEGAKRQFEEKRRLSLVGEMSAVLAHEIRNPLASLKGNAQLLAEHLPDPSADRAKADRVVLEASRLEALTADLLDFVRTGPLDRSSLDPAALLRTCAEDVDPGGFTLHLDGSPDHWALDGPRIRQVLTNLLRNAHQATPPGAPRPEASLAVEDKRLTITIRDHGTGLPKGQAERIFDPFFTTRASGTGLGLAVARRIVELHGGSLTATDHAQGGAVFHIALPGAEG
jgi:two-component system, NtrC family, sensor histidine kinase HydH